MRTGAFTESHYTFDDWLERLRQARTPWGARVLRDQCKIHVCDPAEDANRRLEGGGIGWFHSHQAPLTDLGEGVYRASAQSVVWQTHGPIHIYCSAQQAEELEAALGPSRRPTHALAVAL